MYLIFRTKLLTEKHINAIRKFQNRIRGLAIKRQFFKALNMNKYLEHKRNFLKLKKCLKKFQRFQRNKKVKVKIRGRKRIGLRDSMDALRT